MKKRHNRKSWNPYNSKWKAADAVKMKVGLKGDENILYLGASTGTTVSHLSGFTSCLIFGVEISPQMAIKLVRLSESKENVIPVFSDARDVNYLKEKVGKTKIDILFQDIPSRDQVEILTRNSELVDKDYKVFLIV